MTPDTQPLQSPKIPFYRNVRTIGILAQLIFVAVMVVAFLIIVNNVTTALSRSNIPADFSFLTARAGVPIAETPIPYTPSDPYWRALLIGFLNTLRVAVVGVILATLLGVLVGVMRLSPNWLLRQIATGYVELIRNTPLAVQIIFWFTAVLSTVPPLSSNPLTLPGGILLSNIGIALPWVFPSYAFSAWLPWLAGSLAIALLIWLLRRRQLQLADRAGSAWPLALLAFLLLAGASYWLVASRQTLPPDLTVDFLAGRGRGTVFHDANGNGTFDAGERVAPYATVLFSVPEGLLEATTSNVHESRTTVPSSFRFPLIRPGEIADAEVTFSSPEDAARFSLEFSEFPSRGMIYEDRNGDLEFTPGEELAEDGTGFAGVRLRLVVHDFERRIVADRDGQARLPRFGSTAETEAAAPVPGARLGRVVTSPIGAAAIAPEITVNHELLASGPLVISYPTVSVSNYDGGVRLSTSFLALLLALVIYTAAFMAEIVRGGLQAVPKGQTEAAKALGLGAGHTFTLIVFPQALRISLPPMISQYLNLTKNSSLAPLAGYGELFAISVIVANQTGASVPATLLLIVAYLVISLAFAVILNIVNDRIALVER
jgi:general L-amino acid transport system permease protein